MDGKRFAFENEGLLAAQQRADAAISELRSQLKTLQEQNIKLESQLHEQAAKAGEWYEKAKAAQVEVEQLRSQSQYRPTPATAIALLEETLLLKANAGGAIKEQIRKALKLLS